MSKTSENLRKLADMLDPDADGPTVGGEVDMEGFFGYDYAYAAYSLDGGKVVRDWCGTCACAMGWCTTHPDMPVLPSHFSLVNDNFRISRYGAHYFPALYVPQLPDARYAPISNSQWEEVFGGSLSSDRPSVVRRLRTLALKMETYHE